MMQKTEVVNVRLPEEVVEWLDSIVDKKLFNSRSEIIRHFLREYVLENNKKEGKQ